MYAFGERIGALDCVQAEKADREQAGEILHLRFKLAFHNVPHDLAIQMRLTALVSSFCHLILVHSSNGLLQTLSNKNNMIRLKKCVFLISDTEAAG